MKKLTIKSAPKDAPLPLKFYLPEELDRYIRESAKANYRTISGQIEAMLRHAQKAGI